MSRPEVSVIVTVYNRFELTKRAVESVLAQTLPVSEILLIDDGSFDGTSELLSEYAINNLSWRQHVRYWRQENLGPGAARNNGIHRAQGEWLAFIDNDDLWLPQKLEWQFRALDQFTGECGACITDAWFMNNQHMKMTLFQLAGKRHTDMAGVIGDPLRYILETNSVVGIHPVWLQNLVTRTELARRVGGFDPKLRFGDDDDFVFRLACETKLCYVDLPMVLIDRAPPAERHIGANRDWDRQEFRLRMAEYRYQKRLDMGERLAADVRKRVRRDLSAVHSGWANWYLQKKDYPKARKAATEAARVDLTANIAIKWALTHCIPTVARKLVSLRETQRSRREVGLG